MEAQIAMISLPEHRVLDLLMNVRDNLTTPAMTRVRFQETMGMLRDAIVILERKKAGCLQGLHFTMCSCTERGQSFSTRHLKDKARKKETA